MDEPIPQEYEPLLALAERERAPSGLRARLAADHERLAFRGVLFGRLRLTGALAAAAALAGVVVGLAVPGGGAPSVLEAARLGARSAVAAAPPVRPENPQELDLAVDGVSFPAWGPELRWTASGARTDALDGRHSRTVFYDSPRGARLGYTIVDGAALAWPDGARAVRRRGVEIHVLRDGGRIVVSWRVAGHSCVISAPSSVAEERLVDLASRSTYTL